MSAIFGILDLEGRPIDPNWIKSMQEDLAHRGPDGQGLYQENSIVLGNMLLQVTPESIYDKSPYEEGGMVITANARLDEREALMDRLNIAFSEREKTTDPVLLLRSYLKYGKDFVKDIYGDFTFAIWDKEKKELFCARDQMGVKPFLYYFEENRFVFSTEMKSIVKLPIIKTEIDQNYLLDQAIGIVAKPQLTCWKNIYRLPAANLFHFINTSLFLSEYWTPVYKPNALYKTEEDSISALLQLLKKIISDHCRVIGNIGVPLSGGLDSTTIACLATRLLEKKGKRLQTVSSVLGMLSKNQDDIDEMSYIKELLKQEKNIDPAFIYHSQLEFLANLNLKFSRHYAPVNKFHYVDEAIYNQFKSKSIRRLLSGYLGDTTISNSTINPLLHLIKVGRYKSFLKLFSQLKKGSEQSLLALIKTDILFDYIPMPLLKIWYQHKGETAPWEITKLPLNLISTEKKILQERMSISYRKNIRNTGDISRNIWPTNCESFEEDWDCSSSYHAIEITYPLGDRRIIEFLHQVPVEHFKAEGKQRGLLRKTMKGLLPEMIRNRKDKTTYSPGFHHIIQKDIKKLKLLINNPVLQNQMGALVNLNKTISQLDNLLLSENNCTFVQDFWVLLDMSIWITFIHWDLHYNKNL